MNVFLSWAKERSRHVAQSLKEWLPIVFDDVNPWLSTRDIQAGERWGTEIGRHLEEIDFGIICLTPENLESPWILFEAGALSREPVVLERRSQGMGAYRRRDQVRGVWQGDGHQPHRVARA